MPRGRKKKEDKEEKSYSVCEEAEVLIKDLTEHYPDILWSVTPGQVSVFGVDNAERPASCQVLAKIRVINGVHKALLEKYNVGVKYLIEMYWSDWNEWKTSIKLAIISKHLFEITPDVEKKNAPDCKGFKILYDVLGINWEKSDGNGIPNLLTDEVSFNLEYLPGMDGLNEEEDDDI